MGEDNFQIIIFHLVFLKVRNDAVILHYEALESVAGARRTKTKQFRNWYSMKMVIVASSEVRNFSKLTKSFEKGENVKI